MLALTRPLIASASATRRLRVPSRRRPFTSSSLHSAPRRTRDFSSSFAATYDADEEGRGPMFTKSTFGVPLFYPRDLKRRVDEYVVGQERAKKTISSVIFNHYQNIRRRRHQEEQERKREQQLLRRLEARDRHARERERETDNDGESERDPHPLQGSRNRDSARCLSTVDEDIEDELPGHHEPVQHDHHHGWHQREPDLDFYVPEDAKPQPVKIDKSNLMLIGPTGVGKTYILETLSKKINVPFTISDCNAFTQAGYIGQDVETCIERLLIESNYDITATEHGIVVLDEFDKIAKRETMNGRDVGGEGVQQALLKIVEGTKVTVNVKDNRSSSSPRSANPITTSYSGPGSNNSSSGPQPGPPPSGKVDQYTIDTSNILFVFCGAFVGLDKVILNRVAKPSMGFGSELRRRGPSSDSNNASRPDLPLDLFKHLPHQPPNAADDSALTALDLTTPEDLQAFGFIPELIGRVHNITALSPLSRADLLRILTEPRNSLVAQYTALFETYPSNLTFTKRSLAAIAQRAERAGTGARALKMEMERVLAEAMFDAPCPYVLVTENAVLGKEKCGYWGKDGRLEVEKRVKEDDGDDEAFGSSWEVVGRTNYHEVREAGVGGA